MTTKADPLSIYNEFISPQLKKDLLSRCIELEEIPGLSSYGALGGLETVEALRFCVSLYRSVAPELSKVLEQRKKDRKFIDQRITSCCDFNQKQGIRFSSKEYITPLGLKDGEGRIVFGPLEKDFSHAGGDPVAPYSDSLKGPQVTLFGPPDSPTMAINAMNAYYRKLPGEPKIVEDLLKKRNYSPRWGADLEDSKTPLRSDMVDAAENLTACIRGDLEYYDKRRNKEYKLAEDHLSLAIKRFPGLALPCGFLFYQGNNFPLHIYDFALHIFHNWNKEEGLLFYVPKLENEEEARYIHSMVSAAEQLLAELHPEYVLGSIRLMIVLENPRAILRIHEIIDTLHPYFLGISLGWHDYLASTARLFKEDHHYRIPVKADPEIVIKHIKASHDLVAKVVGSRGGITVGGMYGILPLDNDLLSPSFQTALKGYFKDTVTQLKRGLSGFWVAHPDFVRLGLAIVIAWEEWQSGEPSTLERLVRDLLNKDDASQIMEFIDGDDIESLDYDDPDYIRDLIVANLEESDFIPNNDPEEIRFNIFQALQYLADWLSGNGCVALPSVVEGQAVRVMDDLATTERSRWEVWHEIHHNRFSLEDFLQIAHEELQFIKNDQSHGEKIVQVKWDDRTASWYPVAFKIMIKLMTDPNPVEFASELLFPFILKGYRNGTESLQKLEAFDPKKYKLPARVERYEYYFEQCGCHGFALEMSQLPIMDRNTISQRILNFTEDEIREAAEHHGDIGAGKQTLDRTASSEQAKVLDDSETTRTELLKLGKKYKEQFGFKYLVSAKGKSGTELLDQLKSRMNNSKEIEVNNARQALAEITLKRCESRKLDSLCSEAKKLLQERKIMGAGIAVTDGQSIQSISLGKESHNKSDIGSTTLFDIASLSKSLATAFSLEILKKEGVDPATPVNQLLESYKSPFCISSTTDPSWNKKLRVQDLISHCGLNMHYVNAISHENRPSTISELMANLADYGYGEIDIINEPGTVFSYSGAGFMVLEHLMEIVLGDEKEEAQNSFLASLGMNHSSFQRGLTPGRALGHFDDGTVVSAIPHWFPSYAAGCLASPSDMLLFLQSLERAYHDDQGFAGISHDTAVAMLHGKDQGSREFMGLDMGLGVFIGEAGDNRIAIHQGANEGYRAIYFHCFDGPDRGKGFVIFCNGDNAAVEVIAELAKKIIGILRLEGFDASRIASEFTQKDIPQEQIVNRGYKELLFSGFLPALPEAIERIKEPNALLSHSLLQKARIIEVSNQRFARAENLFSVYPPYFDVQLYGRQGKIMDSWETSRHNSKGKDYVILEVPEASEVEFIYLSTEYHDGNHGPFLSVEARLTIGPRTEGRTTDGSSRSGNRMNDSFDTDIPWNCIVAKTAVEGHSQCKLRLKEPSPKYNQFRISIYPDGGLSRVGLFAKDHLSAEQQKKFNREIKWQRYSQAIPKQKAGAHLPLDLIQEAWKVGNKTYSSSIEKSGGFIDYASLLQGGTVEKVSNQHYSPAENIISPFAPIDMSDGFESARSREPDHFEELIIGLGKPIVIKEIQLDFTYFVNNNPNEITIQGYDGKEWIALAERIPVKAFAGNIKTFAIDAIQVISKVKLLIYPEGGINRVRVFGQ